MPKTSTVASAKAGFAYSPDHFRQLVTDALAFAKSIGASDAGAEVSEGVGLSVSVRKGEIENVERNRDKSMGVSVYIGQRRGNANTSDFSRAAMEQTVRAAYDIARFTAEDPAAGLPDAANLAMGKAAELDLDLFHPWDLNAEQAAEISQRCEQAALDVDARITNSEGAGVSAQQSHFISGNSRGFLSGYASSRHSLSVAPIASIPGKGAKAQPDMQRDAWYTSMRAPEELASAESVGRYAAQRAMSRLKSRKLKTCEVPVLFESSIASGLLGAYVQATSGGALYRKSTFLLDSLGKQVLPKHIDILENPHVLRGKASSPFDDEGVLTTARTVLLGGVVQSYFLSTYSGRKLGMPTTGHAGGSHNLVLNSRLTQAGDDLDAMLRKLDRGLFVIELMGQGVNYVTGDYSRGATGFWVEGGRIKYPVSEITIAGNLKQMFKGIQAVGADRYTMGGKTSGSVLINKMKIAGT
jgi:PmbA protein